jgi:hypothetical protein
MQSTKVKGDLVSPVSDGNIPNQSRIQIQFLTRNGIKLKSDTFKMTYMKTPLIDLTQRVAPYVSDSGVDVPKAIMARGKHLIRFEIMDIDGRLTSKLVQWNVESSN